MRFPPFFLCCLMTNRSAVCQDECLSECNLAIDFFLAQRLRDFIGMNPSSQRTKEFNCIKIKPRDSWVYP